VGAIFRKNTVFTLEEIEIFAVFIFA